MRKRGRPQDELTEDDLREWQAIEVEGLYERMQRVAPVDQLEWLKREWTDAVERFARRRERWRLAVDAQDIFEDVLDVVERVANGKLEPKMQAMSIDHAFNRRGYVLNTDLFVERAADTPDEIRSSGGSARWSMRFVAKALGVTRYAMHQHRSHRLRIRAGVMDTLATPISEEETDDDEEYGECNGW